LAKYGIRDFSNWCANTLTIENGHPLRIETFQRKALSDYFNKTTETLVLVPKKNGKTTLLGALALYHLLNVEDAECVIAAASRDQATILFDQATGFVRRSITLESQVATKRGFREIRSLRDAGRIRVLASDVDTADGVIPTLALVDELHRHKSADLYGIFRDGLGPRSGRMITISTAGASEDSPLGVIRTKALQLPAKVDGCHRYVRSPDGNFAMHEWALDVAADRDDMDEVVKANPATWQTKALLRRRHLSPTTTPWQWARFACNIWSEDEEQFFDPRALDRCVGEVELPEEIWAGVDIGQKKDSTAVVAVGWQGNVLHVQHKIRVPTSQQPISIKDAKTDILILFRDYRLQEVLYDPWRFQESAEELGDQGVPTIEFPQTDSRMAPASEVLWGLVEQGRLVWDGDPEFRRQMLACVAQETERGSRVSKRKSKARIDAAIALAMAVSRARPSIYTTRGMVAV
jgi:phage terminase large subunit-like protein